MKYLLFAASLCLLCPSLADTIVITQNGLDYSPFESPG